MTKLMRNDKNNGMKVSQKSHITYEQYKKFLDIWNDTIFSGRVDFDYDEEKEIAYWATENKIDREHMKTIANNL